MTLGAFLRPEGVAALVLWEFLVLSAAQLTIRLIMAFSVGPTLRAALVLSLFALPVAALYDALAGGSASFANRLAWAPVPMLLMALAGFATAQRVLLFKRRRGQIIAGGMVGLLAPHLFTLAATLQSYMLVPGAR